MCVSHCRVITLSSDLQREERRHNQPGSTHTFIQNTHIHTQAEPVILKLHFLMDSERTASLVTFERSVNTSGLR